MKLTKLIPFVCLLVLTGCGSKGESEVFTRLNNQIVSQNQCNENNQQLTDLMAKETEIYNSIIEKGTDSFEEVKEFVEQGKQNIESSKQLLNEYDLCVRGSLVDQEKLTKEKDAIKDSKTLEEATLLIEQYVIYETSLTAYIESLIKLNETQAAFYNELNESTSIQTIEDLVNNINSAIDEANVASDAHHDALIAFNELYSKYYETYIQ